MDTQEQALELRVPRKKVRRRSIEERRKIVEETMVMGASVARVARRHDVNANQVFYWRKLYREGRLGGSKSAPLLPVEVGTDRSVQAVKEDDFAPRLGSMEIKLSKGMIRIFGTVDVLAVRAVIECLIG